MWTASWTMFHDAVGQLIYDRTRPALVHGARLAWLYEHGEVLDRHDADSAVHVTVRLLPADRARFEHYEK